MKLKGNEIHITVVERVNILCITVPTVIIIPTQMKNIRVIMVSNINDNPPVFEKDEYRVNVSEVRTYVSHKLQIITLV